MEAANIKSENSYMPGLDGLRGVAILVVMFHHFLPPNYPQGIPSGLEGFAIKVMYRLCDVGWWGVDLFFVLSGFLITGILLASKDSSHYFRNFYIRRSLRIFPLYYGVLAIIFWILPALHSLSLAGGWVEKYAPGFLKLGNELHSLQPWLWFYGVNVKTAMDHSGWIFSTLTHFWTLAVEEHFYLLWPMVIFFSSSKWLVRICLIVASASVLCRAGLLIGGLAPAYIYIFTPCRMDGLVLGSLAAALFRSSYCEQLLTVCRKSLRYLVPLALLTMLTLNRFGNVMIILGHALLACLFAAMMPQAAIIAKNSTIGRFLHLPVLRTFGKYSYGIYVLHPFVIHPIGHFLDGPIMSPYLTGNYALGATLRISLGISCAISLAFVSWHLFEKHFLKLKHFFPSRIPRSPLTTSMVASIS